MTDTQALVLAAVGGPLLLALLTHWLRQREKREDYARQDAVAKNLRESNSRVAAGVQDVSEKLDTTTTRVDRKLDVIHTLVNSDLTGALSGQRAALLSTIALLKRGTPTAEDLKAIEAAQEQADDLAGRLAQRRRAQAAVEATEE